MSTQTNLNIALYQMDTAWKAVDINLQQLNKLQLPNKTDLLVLPEMFATGFCMDAEEISIHSLEITQWMQNYSLEKKVAVTGSVAVNDSGKYYNRLYFFDDGKCISTYDKRHLFSYSGEDKIYTAGSQREVFHWKGWRILPQICYDLRFPVWSRNQEDYDLMINVANWPVQRVAIWSQLLPSRSIENMSYVAACNRMGEDGNNLEYNGQSGVFFPSLEKVSLQKEENLLLYTLSLEKLQEYRKKFLFLKDRDSFTIKY